MRSRTPEGEDALAVPHGEGEPEIWQVPAGAGRVQPFPGPAELLDDLLGIVRLRLEAAVHERAWMGLDAGSSEPDALLHGPATEPPRALGETLARARRRHAVFARRLEASLQAAPPPALALAFARWGLAPAEQLLLGCAVGVELSPLIARLVARAGGDAVHGMTVEAAAFALGGGAQGVLRIEASLAPGRPLYDLGLLVMREPDTRPLLRRSLALAPRVLDLARGALGLDARARGMRLAGADAPRAPDALVDTLPPADLDHLRDAVRRPGPPFLLLRARADAGAWQVVAHVARLEGRPLLRVQPDALAGADDARAVVREAVLHDAVAGLEVAAAPVSVSAPASVPASISEDDPRQALAVARQLAAAGVPVMFVAVGAELGQGTDAAWPAGPVAALDLPLPDRAARHRLWQRALGAHARSVDLALIAATLVLGAGGIDEAARIALARVRPGRPLDTRAVLAAVHARRGPLPALARRLSTAHGWPGLGRDALEPAVQGSIDAILRGARAPGSLDADALAGGRARPAIAAVIAGADGSAGPGYSATAVAGLIAHDLGLDLLAVDLAHVAACWSEAVRSQLAAAFDAAAQGFVLVLHTADALFDAGRALDAPACFVLDRLDRGSSSVIVTGSRAIMVPALVDRTTVQVVLPDS